MTWRKSLIRISSYEVETLQLRLAEVVERRTAAEVRLAVLEAEAVSEMDHARREGDAGFRLTNFMAGVRLRRDAIQAQIAEIAQEEAGARDALAEAFEAMKKFEHVAEMARLADVKEANRRETAAFDELGLRSRAG